MERGWRCWRCRLGSLRPKHHELGLQLSFVTCARTPQLLELVGAWAGDPGVVLLAAPALQAILATAPFLTAATFAKFDLLAVAAAAALKQAEAAPREVGSVCFDVKDGAGLV